MLRLENISKLFAGSPVFTEVSLHVRAGQRIGLVGDNGAGKSTLLKIMTGSIVPDEGRRIMSSDTRVGLLEQETGGSDKISILESVIAGATHIKALQAQMDKMSDKLHEAEQKGDNKFIERLAESFAEAQDKFNDAGGYALEGKARGILAGLGFSPNELDRPVDSFSGGWRMRMQLARLLLFHPEVLLLDEPTNHLDLESSIWLERFLSSYDGALVIISHDRYFLNRMVNAIAEIEHGKLTLYPFPYNKYVVEKKTRKEQLEASATRQQKEIERQERFIERFRAKNTKATLVQSRVKALAKIERIETTKGTSSIGFRFEETGRIGAIPVEVLKARVAYGEKVVYDSLDFAMRRGDRIALVGPNGAGKSTLIKLLSGGISPKEGMVRISASVSMRYFAQHQVESLDPNKTVLDELTSSIPFDKISRARGTLGAFLFRNDDVDKKIKVLSGGEKSRVALAKIALNPTNLLLLDEPTNHLDLKSRQALERSLANYGGCILFISHDRAFIDAVANKIIHIEDGKFTEFLGDWDYYERNRAKRLATSTGSSPATDSSKKPAGKKSKKESRQEAAKQRKALSDAVGPLKKELKLIEVKIAEDENQIALIEKELADPETHNNPDMVSELSQKLQTIKSKNGKLLSRWEMLSEKIDTKTSQLAQ